MLIYRYKKPLKGDVRDNISKYNCITLMGGKIPLGRCFKTPMECLECLFCPICQIYYTFILL